MFEAIAAISVTKLIEVLNVRNRGGKLYSKTGFSRKSLELLKLFELKGKIRKEDVRTQYFFDFDNLLKDGCTKPANESGFYELTEEGRNGLDFLKKQHKTLYKNL